MTDSDVQDPESEPWGEYLDEVDEHKVELFADSDDRFSEEEWRITFAKNMWEDEVDPIELLEHQDEVVEVVEDTTRDHTLWVKTEWSVEKPGDIGLTGEGDFGDTINWMTLRHTIRGKDGIRITNTREYEGHFTITVSRE